MPGKDFAGNHGLFSEFVLPKNEEKYEEEANEQGAEDVGGGPGVCVTAALEGYEAEVVSSVMFWMLIFTHNKVRPVIDRTAPI